MLRFRAFSRYIDEVDSDTRPWVGATMPMDEQRGTRGKQAPGKAFPTSQLAVLDVSNAERRELFVWMRQQVLYVITDLR